MERVYVYFVKWRDEGVFDRINEPGCALTKAVAAASVPIVLGGHSLVAGGAWALSERVRVSASASDAAMRSL